MWRRKAGGMLIWGGGRERDEKGDGTITKRRVCRRREKGTRSLFPRNVSCG